MAALKERIIDLEDSYGDGTTILVRYRGVLTPVTKERLLQMMRREEAYLGGERAQGAEAPVLIDATAEPVARKPRQDAPKSGRPTTRHKTGVSHAGLSVRVKRMYNYNQSSRRLRATHAEHLEQILDAFDWIIPDHPNSMLDFHLKEISAWDGVSDALRVMIAEFIARYTNARYRRPAPPT